MDAQNVNVPKIYDRDEIIILSDDIQCNCGRAKNRPHCPACGSVQKYAQSERMPAKLESGDVIKNVRIYRCIACGQKYNDIDWYFNCQLSPKVDVAATKKLYEAQARKERLAEWDIRIRAGEKFNYNDKTSFKSQCGGSLDDYIDLIRKTDALMKQRLQLEQYQSKEERLDKLIAQKLSQIALKKEHLAEATDNESIEEYKFAIEQLERQLVEFQKLKEGDKS